VQPAAHRPSFSQRPRAARLRRLHTISLPSGARQSSPTSGRTPRHSRDRPESIPHLRVAPGFGPAHQGRSSPYKGHRHRTPKPFSLILVASSSTGTASSNPSLSRRHWSLAPPPSRQREAAQEVPVDLRNPLVPLLAVLVPRIAG
jgi:hypothetical protein